MDRPSSDGVRAVRDQGSFWHCIMMTPSVSRSCRRCCPSRRDAVARARAEPPLSSRTPARGCLTFPYGKFAHGLCRFPALVRYACEKRTLAGGAAPD